MAWIHSRSQFLRERLLLQSLNKTIEVHSTVCEWPLITTPLGFKAQAQIMKELQMLHYNTKKFHTRAVPDRNLDHHAEKKLSFGDVEGFLLVFLLPEEHQTISVLWSPVDLHRCHFPMFLELMEQSIFQTCVWKGKWTVNWCLIWVIQLHLEGQNKMLGQGGEWGGGALISHLYSWTCGHEMAEDYNIYWWPPS